MGKIGVSHLALLASAVFGKFGGDAYAQTLPTDGTVVSGSISIDTPSASSMVVTQDTVTGIINWSTFDIGAGASVHFAQPTGNSATLNRVTGSTSSTLAGNLTATGSVMLVNPNGIAIMPGAIIDTGSFAASTLDIADADFLSGKMTFRGNGKTATVSNAGAIRAATGGAVALIGGNIINEGIVEAKLGRIALAAGDLVTLDFGGDGFLSVGLTESEAARFNGIPTGSRVQLGAGDARRTMIDAVLVPDNFVATTASRDASGIIRLGDSPPADGAGQLQLGGTISAEGGTISAATNGVAWLTGAASTSGVSGGEISLSARNILSSGALSANGAEAAGVVDISASGRFIATTTSQISANGAEGGNVSIRAGDDIFSSGTVSALGSREQGGDIRLVGSGIVLAGATIDASGEAGGGSINIGYAGDRSAPDILADTIDVTSSTLLRADALGDGDGGLIGFWSRSATSAFGRLYAREAGRGRGGFIETSSRGLVSAGGEVDAGRGGRYLLDPKNIRIVDNLSGANFYDLISPTSSSGDGFGVSTVALANGNIVVAAGGDDFGATNAGAVFLFDGVTGALRSALTGSTLNDAVGGNGVLALTNGNYVVRSGVWDNGTIFNAGAVTWGSGVTGVSGTVSAANSLVGSSASDQIGTGIVTALVNGNYIVASGGWDNGAVVDAGAVTWGSGTAGISGVVSASNSLVGSSASDLVGSAGVLELSNGNYLVRTNLWDNGAATNAGAVTWGSGTGGVAGAISASNSLVGTTTSDQIGNTITTLANGNYVVTSTAWDNGGIVDAGAVTWGSGTTGVAGAVSASNSLVGSSAGDVVGNGGVTVLNNGNFVVRSSVWDNGALTNAGAVTWGSGTSGVAGAISASNSLVGSTAADQVGQGGVVALSNGNYTVTSYLWDNGAVANAGAVTWGSGTAGVVGTVSAFNSLVGSQTGDQVGGTGVVALSNGNYVVRSHTWANGAVQVAGAVTWGSGATGIAGVVSAANSLVGSSASDGVGLHGVTALANGNYVVSSYFWNNGAVSDAGAVTWGSGTTGVAGVVSASNSLVGSHTNDYIGLNGVTALNNGNYVVNSSAWNSDSIADVGAVTWGSGTSGVSGVVSASNSLIGDIFNSRIGYDGVQALSNGNYLVRSSMWNNNTGALTWGSGATGISGVLSSANSLLGVAGSRLGLEAAVELTNGNFVIRSSYFLGTAPGGGTSDFGAVTWGSGVSGIAGTVSDANSLVGDIAGQSVGSGGIVALSNGNYVVVSPGWDIRHPVVPTALLAANVGAVTWGSGTTGVAGAVSSANSLVGSTANDAVGGSGVLALASGDYLVRSHTWDNSGTVDAGAVTFGSGTSGVSGAVNGINSIVGVVANARAGQISPLATGSGSDYIVPIVGANLSRVAVGLTNPNQLTFGRAQAQNITLTSAFIRNVLNAGTDVILQASNDLTVDGASSLTTNNPSGDGGALTLQAGRSLFINGNINTDNGDLTLLANAPLSTGVIDAYRDSGAAVISITGSLNAGTGDISIIMGDGAGKTSATSGDITVGDVIANRITVLNAGETAGSDVIILPSGVWTANAAGRAITVGARNGTFTHNSSTAAFLTPNGYFHAYADSPLNAAEGVDTFTKRYNVDWLDFLSGAGLPSQNTFAYDIAPVLTITAASGSRTYGDSNPTLGYTVGGFIDGDTAAGLSGAAGLSTSAIGASGIGDYDITAALGTLASEQGYQFAFADGVLTVTARPISISADTLTKAYGDANPTLSSSLTSGSLVNGDTLTGALSTSASATSGVGAYAINQGTLSAGSNYAVTFSSGTLTVTPRPITLTANDLTKIYGSANPALTSAISSGSLVNGDTLSGALTTSASGASGVGAYTIGQGTLSAGANYAVTFNAGVLTVTPRPITITADDLTKIYGAANPALTSAISSGALVNGDTLTGALTTSASTSSGVGAYAIGQGTLSAGANYSVTFNAGVLTVTPRPITVTADDLTKIYGAANPALTASVTSGALVNGDVLAGSLATTAGATSGVGDYAISQGSLSAGANYAVTFEAGVLTVTPRPITLSADDVTRIYGDANPALAASVTAGALVNGDTLTGALATGATVASGVGTYGITQGTLGAGGNYAVTFDAGALTVTPRPITLTADDLTRMYGAANPALTYSPSSGALVNGDVLTGALSTSAGTTSGVGGYAIGQGTLSAGANYAVTFNAGVLTVTPRPISITADDLTRIYGASNPALTSTITAGSLVNGDTITGALSSAAGAGSGVGGYAITQGTVSAGGNYDITFVAGTLTVTPRPITITADDLTKIYGAANPALTTAVTAGQLVNGDILSGAAATSATASSGVGSYAIGQGSLTAGSNYAVTFNAGILAVTPRAITVAADNRTKNAGESDPAFTYAISAGSLIGGDSLSGALTRETGEAVGSYAILRGTLNNPNYLVTFIAGQMQILAIEGPLPPTLISLPSDALIVPVIDFDTPTGTGPAGVLQREGGRGGSLAALYEGEINLDEQSDDPLKATGSSGCKSASDGVCVAN